MAAAAATTWSGTMQPRHEDHAKDRNPKDSACKKANDPRERREDWVGPIVIASSRLLLARIEGPKRRSAASETEGHSLHAVACIGAAPADRRIRSVP